MHFSAFPNTTLLVVLTLYSRAIAASSEEKVVEPCTVASTNGNFYDLRALTIALPEEGKKPGKNERIEDWHARGFDYHNQTANFTLNVCAPVVGDLEDVVGLGRSKWGNVGAYYTLDSKTYSIG